MDYRIRAAEPRDVPALVVVWRAAVEASHHFLTAADVDWYEDVVAGHLPHLSDLRVAERADGRLLGFVAQDDGEIHMLFVSPDSQGGGVGSTLLAAVASAYDELRLDVNEQNEVGRGFYARRGFEQVGRSEIDGQGRPFPLLHLRRPATGS